MEADIERRYQEYQGRLGLPQFKADLILRKNIAQINQLTGRQTLGHQQVRKLAYLLGYTDPRYDVTSDGPMGISSGVYRDSIRVLIPPSFLIGLEGLDIAPGTKKYLKEVVEVEGTRVAMSQLDAKGRLLYTPDRFRDALGMVC
jgi:hypothetical protein